MPGKVERMMSNVTVVALGAAVGGISGWIVAPGLFWSLMLGGALTAAALRVGYLLFADGRSSSDDS